MTLATVLKMAVEFGVPGEIMKGLLDGSLVRYGGTIRRAAGQPGGGQFVTFLKEGGLPTSGQFNGSTSSVTETLLNAARIVAEQHGHHVTQRLVQEGLAKTQKMLGATMALSGVGAAASVLNLGLSAAGFYIMNQKLNGLQRSVNTLTDIARDTRDAVAGVDAKLDRLSLHVIELRFVALEHGEHMSNILEAVYDIKNALNAESFATLQQQLNELGADGAIGQDRYKTIFDKVNYVRLKFENEVASRRLQPTNDPRRFIDTLHIFRGWALAADIEISLERRFGNLDRAADRAYEFAATTRGWTTAWTEELFPIKELGGVGRFGHSCFDDRILDEEIRRLYSAQRGGLISLRDAKWDADDAALIVARTFGTSSMKDWSSRQIALMNVVDMLEETAERMEGRAAETAYCAGELMRYEDWELGLEEDEEVVFSESAFAHM